MDIIINLTSKELKAIGVTKEVLQDLLSDQINALVHNGEQIIHQVETTVGVTVINDLLPGLVKDESYEPITVFDYIVEKYNIQNVDYQDFWFDLVGEEGTGINTKNFDDYLKYTDASDPLYALYQAIRSEYGSEVDFNCEC